MNIPEHILDTSLQRLRAGESVLDISSSYPEHTAELSELLSLSSEILSISKLPAPTPRKQFKYADKSFALTQFFSQFSFNMRFAAIPLSFLMVLVGGKIIMNATENSLPGQKLYAVKRATEVARINLTQDQEKLAILHLQLTQKRLEELKQAINDNNQESSTAAVVALKEQTEKTLETVPVIAEEKALNNNDQSLLEDLVAINNKQKTLLAEMGTEENPDIAVSILSITQTADESIAKLVAKVSESGEKTSPETPVSTSMPGKTTTQPDGTTTNTTPTLGVPESTIIETLQPAELPMASVIVEPIEPQFRE